jgi:hypothetical protein
MWIPLCAAWLMTARPEELVHYRDFIGPPKPSGWTVLCHPDNERRMIAEEEARKMREYG